MYFVLSAETEITVMTTDFEDVALSVARSGIFGKCLVRFVQVCNQGKQHRSFFKEENLYKMEKSA